MSTFVHDFTHWTVLICFHLANRSQRTIVKNKTRDLTNGRGFQLNFPVLCARSSTPYSEILPMPLPKSLISGNTVLLRTLDILASQ